jgi:hypothetical protein
MRVTVSHDKGLQGARKIVDDSAEQLFKGAPGNPLQIVEQQKRWDGNTMHFSFTAKMGIFTAPLKGFVEVTEKDVTVECELPGLLKSFIPEEKVKSQVEGRIRGLLT